MSEQPARAKPEERRGDQDGGERGAVGLAQVPAETLVQEPERGPADGPIGDGAGEDERTENADHTARLSGLMWQEQGGSARLGSGLGRWDRHISAADRIEDDESHGAAPVREHFIPRHTG